MTRSGFRPKDEGGRMKDDPLGSELKTQFILPRSSFILGAEPLVILPRSSFILR